MSPFGFTFATPALVPFEHHHLRPDYDWFPGAPGRPQNFYAPAAGAAEVVVSLITPTRNPGPVFEETIAAVLGQSLQAWEWLIVDDASTDPEAVTRLDALAARDARVRLTHLATNHGPGGARNVALQQAQGRYVFFIDDDDLIEPTTLEKLAWFLEAYPHCYMTKGSTTHFGAHRYHDSTNFHSGAVFLNYNPVTPRALVRRAALLDVGGFDESLTQGMEDWDLWLKLADRGYWGHGIFESLDWYRRRTDHSDRWSAWTDQGIGRMRQLMRQRYPRLFREGIPVLDLPVRAPFAPIPTDLPYANLLAKTAPRLLFIMPWMAMGGADRFNLNFLQDWVRRGYQCTVVTTLDCNYPWYREYARLTPDVFILPYFLPPDQHPRFLDYLIRSRAYDAALVSNSEWGYHLLPYLRARHPELPLVDYTHIEEEYWNSGGYPRMAAAFQDVLDLNLVTSEHLKQWMVSREGDPAQIDVVYINVDTELFRPSAELRAQVRARLKLTDDIPVIVYAGRICAQKQPHIFAAVMRELKRRHKRFVCMVLGDGEDWPWLRRYIFRNRLDGQVWLMGAVSNEAMREYLAATDIFFLPSQMEGISLAIYEAMAMGLAVVGADVGGQRELVTPECGILIQRPAEAADEIQRYAEALGALLDDPERQRGLGAAARAQVELHFRLPDMGEEMVKALLERAPALQAARPKPAPGIKLSLEHIQETLEAQRLAATVEPLIKYAALESLRRRSSARARALWQRFEHSTLWRRVLKPLKDALWIFGHQVKKILRGAKDALWILGHRIKGILRGAKDALWIFGHRIKVRLGLARD